MKRLFLVFALLILSSSAFAHGGPSIDEFQMFPDTFTQTVIANPAGGIVAIPFAAVGAIMGLIMSPFEGDDIRESILAGVIFNGMCGYMVGQQVGWPFYGVEKGIEWCFE